MREGSVAPQAEGGLVVKGGSGKVERTIGEQTHRAERERLAAQRQGGARVGPHLSGKGQIPTQRQRCVVQIETVREGSACVQREVAAFPLKASVADVDGGLEGHVCMTTP